MKFNYCPICGRKLEIRDSFDEGGVPYCPVDDIMYFDTPKPCIVVAIVKDREVLLLKQNYIYENCKVLLSGYVTNGENVEETVHREVLEEAGLTIKDLKYLGSEYLHSKELVMLTFMAKYDSGEISKSPEVDCAEWISLDMALSEMSEDEVGKKIVSKVLEQLT
ncbi:MAG: NAD(+) diphosphatase [Solirubrobacterales bacterium]